MSYRYTNGRMVKRDAGRFAKVTMQDIGIGGICPTCHHFLLRVYEGNPSDQNPDPRKFRDRCFTCEPIEAQP